MSQDRGKQTFYCPKCGAKLSFLDGTVVKLQGKLQAPDFSVQTQFFFPAKLGQYGAIVSGPVTLKEGARVEFFCPNPKCGVDFTAAYNPDLSEIRMVDERGGEFVVVFHKIYGKKATFVVDRAQNKLVQKYGEDADDLADAFERPLNFFGAI